jgi:hypothetical protein
VDMVKAFNRKSFCHANLQFDIMLADRSKKCKWIQMKGLVRASHLLILPG